VTTQVGARRRRRPALLEGDQEASGPGRSRARRRSGRAGRLAAGGWWGRTLRRSASTYATCA